MFKRELQVKMVNPKKVESSEDISEPPNYDETIDKVVKAVNTVIFRITLGVCAYVAVDTYRKILIANNTRED